MKSHEWKGKKHRQWGSEILWCDYSRKPLRRSKVGMYYQSTRELMTRSLDFHFDKYWCHWFWGIFKSTVTILEIKEYFIYECTRNFNVFSNHFAVHVCTSENIFLKLLKSTFLRYSALGGLRVRGRGLGKGEWGRGVSFLEKFSFLYEIMLL